MSNSSISILDASSVNQPIAVALLGDGKEQQTICVGDGVNTGRWMAVDSASRAQTKQATSGTGTITSVNGSASSVTVLASNAARLGAILFNDSTAILYLALTSATASTTAYTVQVGPNGYYELPPGSIYTGQINGIWDSATGAVRVTELT